MSFLNDIVSTSILLPRFATLVASLSSRESVANERANVTENEGRIGVKGSSRFKRIAFKLRHRETATYNYPISFLAIRNTYRYQLNPRHSCEISMIQNSERFRMQGERKRYNRLKMEENHYPTDLIASSIPSKKRLAVIVGRS